MVNHLRLKAAVGTALMAGSMATPLVAGVSEAHAAAPQPRDLLSSLTSVLGDAGIDQSTISQVTDELTALQNGNTTTSLSGITSVVSDLNGQSGDVLGSLLNTLTGATSTSTGLGNVVNALSTIGDGSSSTAVQTVVDTLTSAIESSGLSQLLSVAGVPTSTVSSVVSELSGLTSLASGQSASAGSLGSLGSLLGTVISTLTSGGAPSSVTQALTDAESILNGSGSVSPDQLIQVITDLTGAAGTLGSGNSLTATIQGIVSQLTASGSLTSAISGVIDDLSALSTDLPTGDLSSLLTGLQGLTSLQSGAPTTAGSLSGVATLLNQIAAESGVSGTPAATVLQTVASTLGSGSLDPSTLLGAFGQLNGVTTLPSGLQSLLNQVTDALGGSGSLLGSIPGVSDSDLLGALANLGGLSSLTGGGTITGGLGQVATVLNGIAGETGVSGTPAATILQTVASDLAAGNLTPATLTTLISSLTGAASTLPTDPAGVVNEIAEMLGGSGTLLNGTGLSASTLTSALSALSQLPGLSSGVTLPAALTSPIASLLTEIGNQSGVPAQVKTILDSLATTLQSPLGVSTLQTVIKDLGVVGSLLPSPLSTVVEGLTGELAGSGSLVGVPASTTSTTKTGTTSTVGVSATNPGSSTKTTTTPKTGTSKAASKKGPLKIASIKRTGKTLVVTVTCAATGTAQCKSTVSAGNAGHLISSKKVTLTAGKRTTVKLSLKKLPHAAKTAAAHHKKVAVKVTAKTGTTKVSKSARMLLA